MRLGEIIGLSEGVNVNKRPIVLYHGTKSRPFDRYDPKQAAKGEQFWNPLGNALYATNDRRFAGEFGTYVHEIHIPPGHTYRRINRKDWEWGIGHKLIYGALRRAFKQVGENYKNWNAGTPAPKVNIKKMTPEQQRAMLIDLATKHHFAEPKKAEIAQRVAAISPDDLPETLKYYLSLRPSTSDPEKEKKVARARMEISRMLRTTPPYESIYESMAVIYQEFGEKIGDAWAKIVHSYADELFGQFDFVVFSETNNVFQNYDDKERPIETWEVLIYNPALQKTVPSQSRSRWA